MSLQHHSEDLQIPPSNYRGHQRRVSSFHTTMPTTIQDPPSKEVNVLNKNTGFPEPLSPDRNTTLPHPDADTSPNATIEAPDDDLTRTSSHRSFLHGRHHSQNKASISKGDLKESGLYDNIQYVDRSREDMSVKATGGGALKKDNAADPLTRENEELDEVSETRDEQGYREGERKKGVLRKLNLHKV